MDNDLMARRLRPPSQPSSSRVQPAQTSSPWDVALSDDRSFAPAEPERPQHVPPAAPPLLPPPSPDPAARADVPWDRPAPETWPPSEDADTDYPQLWSTYGAPAAPLDPQAERREADALGDAAPWDLPADDPTLDPDDAMAPVVSDVHAPAGAWPAWSVEASATENAAENATEPANEPTTEPANAYVNEWSNEYVNGNGNGHHAADISAPVTAIAHSDPPRGDDALPDAWVDALSASNDASLLDWPAADDATPPSSSHAPLMDQDPWSITSQEAILPDPPTLLGPLTAPEPAPESAPEEPAAFEPQTDMPAAPPADPQPATSPPILTPVVKSAQILPSPDGSPQSVVLQIELALVDESDRGSMPEAEYEWDAPPPSAWQPTPTQPTQLNWDLPEIAGPHPDQPVPWPTPMLPESPQYRAPVWPPSVSPDPLVGLPAAPNQQPAPTSPAHAAADQVGQVQPTDHPTTPPAGNRFLSPGSWPSSVQTAGLTVLFALLVVVLALFFFQLMTSLL